MSLMDRLHLDNLTAIAARHKEEREAHQLNPGELAHKAGHWLTTEDVAALERHGKVPRCNHAFYFASLAVRTELDVLYILCGQHLPIRLTADEKMFWVSYVQLGEDDKANLREHVLALRGAARAASEELAHYREHGEFYKGVGISSEPEDKDAIRQMKLYLDAAESDGLIHYVHTLDYDPRTALYSLCFVKGFEAKSEPGELLLLMARHYAIEPLDT